MTKQITSKLIPVAAAVQRPIHQCLTRSGSRISTALYTKKTITKDQSNAIEQWVLLGTAAISCFRYLPSAQENS